MKQADIYEKLRSSLEPRLKLQDDKPDETIDSTLHALWLKASGISKSAEFASKETLNELSDEQIIYLNKLLEQRISGIPLAHITGRQSFMGIELLIDSRALIPRKETEILGRKALQLCQRLADNRTPVQVLDVCSGSGNLGLALAHYQPGANIFSSDLSVDATNLIRENAEYLDLLKRIDVRQSDLFASYETVDFYNKTDLIVCNPPYISSSKVTKMNSEIADFEPSMAFDGGMMGFKIIQKLIQEAPKFLSKNGWLVFEVGVGQGPFIIQLCEKSAKYMHIGFEKDNFENIRVIYACSSFGS